MRKFTRGEIVVASLLIAVLLSASTCILPGALVRTYADWCETPNPQTYAAWQGEAAKWHISERVVLTAAYFVPAVVALSIINLFLCRPNSA